VTAEDFASYRLRDEAAVYGTYRDYTIATVPAPHGGPTLIEILNILEGYDLGNLEHNSARYICLVAMAMKGAFADRNQYLGDPAFVDVPQEWMTSKERGAYWRTEIDAGRQIDAAFAVTGAPNTTHVTVVDDAGNCAALTHSLGSASGAVTPGTGFTWNNSMVNFHPLSGHPNSIAPKKGRTTGMSPTLIYRGDKPALVIGAPGATMIITSIAQVLLNILDFEMSPAEAVLAPRFDCQVGPIRCQLRIPDYVCAEVRKHHPVERIPISHGGFAAVNVIGIDPDSGVLSGAADSGTGGMPLLVPNKASVTG
jgi:gamma-glutamyltranspeptidase/glutathione hydrolase